MADVLPFIVVDLRANGAYLRHLMVERVGGTGDALGVLVDARSAAWGENILVRAVVVDVLAFLDETEGYEVVEIWVESAVVHVLVAERAEIVTKSLAVGGLAPCERE